MALRLRSYRLSWLDVRGVLMRAGELFTPVTDPVELIHGLRLKFTWDELDPMLDDEKWGRRQLAQEAARRLALRSSHPLGAGDRARAVLYNLEFGAAGAGDGSAGSVSWKPLPGNWDVPRRQFDWEGGESGGQRPGLIRFSSPGSRTMPLANRPPTPGTALAANAGAYPGASLWFACGAGDEEGRSRGDRGCYGYYDGAWARVRQGDARSFVIVGQVYTPDHTDEVGEPRGGWFYIRRPSRHIDAGIRIVDAATRSFSFVPQQALMLKVEPALGRFDRVLLRVDVTTEKPQGRPNSQGRNEVRLIAYLDGVGEVSRTVLDLARYPGGTAALDAGDEGVAFAPAFGVLTSAHGYVPEFYLAAVRLQQINDGAVEVLRGGSPANGASGSAAAPPGSAEGRSGMAGPRR
jgi:hypothetical protein